MTNTKTEIWAHRGASGYAPENTLPSFELAVKQQADAIELDIQLTKDGEIVVAHDEKLNRVSTGSGYLTHYTLAELKKLNFNKKFKDYGTVKIPTLEEVFELIKPTSLKINIELKTSLFTYEGIEEKVLSLTKGMAMENRVIYSSFNHFTLQRLMKLCPNAETGMLFQDRPVAIVDYCKKLEADAIHMPLYYFKEVNLFEEAQRAYLPVRVWTVNDKTHMSSLKQMGVAAIITNYPDVAKKI